jgi:homogentisate 1,2-dioxygenase
MAVSSTPGGCAPRIRTFLTFSRLCGTSNCYVPSSEQTHLPDNKDTESNFLPFNPKVHVSPTQLAWLPANIPESGEVDFVDGLKTYAGSGDPSLREGIANHVYTANTSMTKRAFVNSDGEMLIIPQQGALDVQTEFGLLFVQPGEILVIPRGIRFRVTLPDGPSRGYITEIWGSYFELPGLGPIGANGLANSRDFLTPVAKYEISHEPWEILYRLGGKLFKSTQNHSPFDVVAWHGNYVCSPLSVQTIVDSDIVLPGTIQV